MTAPATAIAVHGDRGGVRTMPAPPPATEGIPLEILRAGICGTDLQIASRLRDDRARILGHEALAVTVAGDPVVLNPVGVRDQDAILGHSYDGVFRPRCAVPHPEDGGPTLVPADRQLIADLAALAEPVAAALYGWDLVLRSGSPSSVGVWGGGFLGLTCATVATLRGADTVVFCSDAARARWVRGRLGLRAEAPPSPAARTELDAAFLCVPRTSAAEVLHAAARLVRADGVVDLVGGVPGDVTIGDAPGAVAAELRRFNVRGVCSAPGDAERVRRRDGRWLRVTGHRGTADEHLLRAQALLAGHPERFGAMVSHVVSLGHAAEVINRVCVERCRRDAGGDEIVKVVIDTGLDAERRDVDPGTSVGDLAAVA